jgi:hypothetical protein
MNSNSSKRHVFGSLKTIIAAVAVLLVTAGSLVVYLVEREAGQVQLVMGDTTTPDRVDIHLFVQKIDPVTQELSAQVEVVPQGALADEAGAPRQDMTVFTNGTKGDTLPYKAGKTPSTTDLKLASSDGVITDYPFDHYKIETGMSVQTAAALVPFNVTLINGDSFFKIDSTDVNAEGGALIFTVNATRSTGTFAFALFLMLFMWLLSLAAVIASGWVVSHRSGLIWPPMSFMGALLFALVPLRNAAPGAPPIGSVIDFGSFFIAEGLISLSLITAVVLGYRVERAKEREKAAAETPPPPPEPSLPQPQPQPQPLPLPAPDGFAYPQGTPGGQQPWQGAQR